MYYVIIVLLSYTSISDKINNKNTIFFFLCYVMLNIMFNCYLREDENEVQIESLITMLSHYIMITIINNYDDINYIMASVWKKYTVALKAKDIMVKLLSLWFN